MICLESSCCTLKKSKTYSPLGKHPDNLMPYGVLPTYGIGPLVLDDATADNTRFVKRLANRGERSRGLVGSGGVMMMQLHRVPRVGEIKYMIDFRT